MTCRTPKIGLLIVVSVLLAPAAMTGVPDNGGSNTGSIASILSESDFQATKKLIAMTSDVKLLTENFNTIMTASPDESSRLDDAMLEEEFDSRFGGLWKGWDPGIGEPEQELQVLSSSRLQAICWLAECNKRMCFDMPKVREKQRQAIIALIKQKLSETPERMNICALLDIAYRAVFQRWVIPRDGADDVIDLFKPYVGNGDAYVHEYARERLRIMGYLWPKRYKEILQYLIDNAPEIREYLTAKPLIGPFIDILTGLGTPPDLVKEEDWYTLDKAEPSALGATVEKKYLVRRGPFEDCLGEKALKRLVYYGTHDAVQTGEAALQTLTGLVRKGIATSNIIYDFSHSIVTDVPPKLDVVVQHRLDELLCVASP